MPADPAACAPLCGLRGIITAHHWKESDMRDMLDLEPMEFTADIAGALEETRLSPKVITEAIKAVAKVITELA